MHSKLVILGLAFILANNGIAQYEMVQGGIVRADTASKSISLVFTGDEYADGGNHIYQTLKKNKVKASFFFTGNFYTNPQFRSIIKKLKKNNHYLGAHSDKHLLYNDWTDRNKTLVSRDSFIRDLDENYKKMKSAGIEKKDALYFMPPYEWYNDTISAWARAYGLQIINFTPGTYSNADYTYPDMGDKYRSTDWIYDKILTYEKAYSLNGFILLIHIGTDPRRKDKLYFKLNELIPALKNKGYTFKRIDRLLKPE